MVMTSYQNTELQNQEETSEFYERYEAMEVLGRGVSSIVRKCIKKSTGEVFAVKIIDLSAGDSATLSSETKKEITILEVSCSNITMGEVSILRTIQLNNNVISLVMY